MQKASRCLFAVLMLGCTLRVGSSDAWAQQGAAIRTYADLLAKYVKTSTDGINRVTYAQWQSNQADREKLALVIGAMAQQLPSAMNRNDAFAYWANLYNALTLRVIIDNYPVKSIRDIKSTGTSLLDFKSYVGPWRTKLITVERQELALDDIENAIMRPAFKDPRVHYSINCASLGCPNLRLKPWAGATLDADLDDAARAYVNHPRGVAVEAGGRAKVSSIYSWFEEDFGGSKPGVIAHLRKYASEGLGVKLNGVTSFDHDYDWGLNEAR